MGNRELTCRLMDSDGSVIGEIPDFVDVQIQDQLNSENAWTLKYARNGLRATQLIQTTDLYIQFFLGGTKLDFEGVIEQDSWDEVDDADYISLAGRGHAGQFEYAKVYPKNGVGTKPAEQTYTNKTPGYIFRDLLAQAQSRGTLPGFAVDFTDTLDSSGNAWNHTLTLTYKAGVSLLDVVKNFGTGGYADFRMNGKTLRMYNPRTTLGGQSGVVFRRGRDISSAPRKRDRRNLGTSWLIEGDDDVTVVRTDSTAVAVNGRKEQYLSQGGTKDTGTLSVVGDTQLLVYANARIEKTHKLKFDPEGTSPIPWLDYLPGQYVDTDLTGQTENYRLVAMNISMASSAVLEGEVTLNDIFAERQLLLDERIKNLTGGASGSGVSTQPPTKAPPEDTTTPVAPTNLGATSEQYDVPGGVKYSQLTATWDAVTQNTDGSVYNDHDHYEIQWWYTAAPTLKYELTSPINTLSWSSLRPGVSVSFHIRAVDVNAHRSAYSSDFAIVTADDTTPPPKPSDPVVSNWLSTLRVQWDGLGDAGEVMPLDFEHVEVWYSPNAAFVPGDAGSILYDYLPAKGASIISGLPYGFPYYVRFVATDTNNNRSPVSDVASASTQQVVSTDIAGNVIDFSNIRFKDVGNLVPDGSFELATTQAIIGTPGYVQVITNPDGATAAPSPKVLDAKQGTGTLTLVSDISVSPDESYAFIVSHKAVALAGSDSVTLRLRYTLRDNSVQFVNYRVWNSTTNTGTFTLRQAFVNVVPANAVKMDAQVSVAITTATAHVYIDELELRQQQGTVLIQDAAINNAKIALLAVNDANIGNLNVGKLLTGTLTADVTISSRIKTADTGARAELNSGGFGLWNASGVQTVAFAGADGSASILGQLRSGNAGRRIEINPTSTYLPEIRFYPSTGANFGFLNAFSPAGSSSAYIGLNSGQFTWNSQVCETRVYMTDTASSYEAVRVDTQQRWGPYLVLSEATAKIGWNYSDNTDRGHAIADQNYAQIGYNNSASLDNWWVFRNDGTMGAIGKFYNYVAAENNQAIFTGSSSWTSADGLILSYGPTMLSTPQPNIVLYYTGAQAVGWWLNQRSTTGFAIHCVNSTNNAAISLNGTVVFWNFRT